MCALKPFWWLKELWEGQNCLVINNLQKLCAERYNDCKQNHFTLQTPSSLCLLGISFKTASKGCLHRLKNCTPVSERLPAALTTVCWFWVNAAAAPSAVLLSGFSLFTACFGCVYWQQERVAWEDPGQSLWLKKSNNKSWGEWCSSNIYCYMYIYTQYIVQ